MTNVPEEATKAVAGTVDALKSTPVVLGLIILNVIYVGMTMYFVKISGERWAAMIDHLFQSCGPKLTVP